MNTSFYFEDTYDQRPYTAGCCCRHQAYKCMKDRRKLEDNTKYTGYQTADYELAFCSDVKYTCSEGESHTQSGKDQRARINQSPHQIFRFAENTVKQLAICYCRTDSGDQKKYRTYQETCNDRNDGIEYIALKNAFFLIHLFFLLPS